MKKTLVCIALIIIGLSVAGIVFSQVKNKKNTSISVPMPVVTTVPIVTEKAVESYIGQNVPILTYHSFGPKPIKPEARMALHYRITAETFELQMKYLKDNNYHPITLNDLVESIRNKTSLPDKAIVLTFDDGWKTQYTYAVPVLEKYGFTGTFFIITKSIGHSYMSWDELADLHTKGFEIASHTETHPMSTKLDDVKLKQEIEGSKKALETKLGIIVTTLAYPYYNHDDRVMKVVESAGYRGARAGWSKAKNDNDHIYQLTSQEVVNNPNPFSDKRIAE